LLPRDSGDDISGPKPLKATVKSPSASTPIWESYWEPGQKGVAVVPAVVPLLTRNQSRSTVPLVLNSAA
jgi:hypothetical protein